MRHWRFRGCFFSCRPKGPPSDHAMTFPGKHGQKKSADNPQVLSGFLRYSESIFWPSLRRLLMRPLAPQVWRAIFAGQGTTIDRLDFGESPQGRGPASPRRLLGNRRVIIAPMFWADCRPVDYSAASSWTSAPAPDQDTHGSHRPAHSHQSSNFLPGLTRWRLAHIAM